MTDVDTLITRQHVRGSVEAWQLLEKARVTLLMTAKNNYIDPDVVLSLCEDIQVEQDRLITLRGK